MGFSADWLALREPADHAARDGALMAEAAALAGARPVVVDLGAGTGSTRRAFGAALPEGVVWRMVEGDATLLALCEGERHPMDLRDLAALLEGIAAAAAEAGVASDEAARWLAARRAMLGQGEMVIGHLDLLAVPEGREARDADG